MKKNQDKQQKRRYERPAMTLLAALIMAMSALTAQAQTLGIGTEYWDETTNSYQSGTVGGIVTSTHSGAVEPGTKVTLTATPNPGWRFAGWIPLIAIFGGSTATFTMPSNNVTILARFDNRYSVRGVASPTEGGQVKLSLDNSSWSSGTLYVREGQTVYFSISPASGYMLTPGSISIGTDGDGAVSTSGNSFTMPADNVTVSALFKDDPYSTVISTTPHSITVNTYLEEVGGATMVGSASASRSSSSPDNIVTLTATAAPGYNFKEWGVLSGGITISDPSHATTTFRMNHEDVTVKAVFVGGEPSSLMEDYPFANPIFHVGEYAELTRTFSNGVPATVCLPFDFATTQASGTFYTFAGVGRDSDGEWEVTMENTNRISTSSYLHLLNAGTPYLFVPSKDGDVTFSGTVSSLVAKKSAIDSWTFQGTYYQRLWDADHNTSEIGSVYGFATGQGYDGTPASYGAGTFIRLKTGGIKGFRAFMRYNGAAAARGTTRGDGDDEPLPERMRLRLIDADGSTTAMGSINLTTGEASLDGDGPWHTLQGARLATRPTVKGVYIHSGRKVIIR